MPPDVVGSAAVVPLLNGVDHVARLRQRYERVIAASIRTQSERVALLQIVNPSPFAHVELAAGEQTDAVAGVLAGAGFSCAVREDEVTLLLEKLVFLAPLALATTALNDTIGAVRADAKLTRLLEHAQSEALAAARAEGAEIDATALVKAHAAVTGEFTTSMQKDFDAARPLELDGHRRPDRASFRTARSRLARGRGIGGVDSWLSSPGLIRAGQNRYNGCNRFSAPRVRTTEHKRENENFDIPGR